MKGGKSLEFIRAAVNRNPGLSLLAHPGMNHRIKKSGIVGSIWIKPRHDGYLITATGQGISLLYREMERRWGTPFREDRKGYKYWQADDPEKIDEVIDLWGKI